MQRLEVSGALRPIYGSLGVKRLTNKCTISWVIKEESLGYVIAFSGKMIGGRHFEGI